MRGERDREFLFPIRIMGLRDLAMHFEEAGRSCKISLTTTLTWLDNYHRTRTREHVKFLVSFETIAIIQREDSEE